MILMSLIAAASMTAAGPSWKVLPVISQGNLAIFPVVSTAGSRQISGGYITLDEGIKAGTVEISEKGETTPIVRNRSGGAAVQTAQRGGGAEVNELMLVNRSGRKLILLAGEMVIGGKQDRIVQQDAIIPSSKIPISLNVYCVEQGRWQGGDMKFGAGTVGRGGGGALADPTVRAAAQGAGQQQVWSEVAAKNAKSGASGGATTYQETLKSKANVSKVQNYEKAFASFPKEALGAVVAVNGKLIWVDAFLDSTLFHKYWPKLLQSYMIEAATEHGPSGKHPTVEAATQFLASRGASSTFAGKDDVYKLTRFTGNGTISQELADISNGGNLLVHFNKMLKK